MRHLGWMITLLVLLSACKNKPRRNIAFYRNLGTEPSTLNPITSTDSSASSVQEYIVEKLLQRDDETYQWRPMLATKWKISEDKKTFTFWLREGVRWHDGKPFTAADVEYSFKTTFDIERWKNADKQFLFDTIESVKAIDQYKVEVKVKNTIYSNFGKIAESLQIIPKHFYEQNKKRSFFNKNVIGTGPYKLELYNRGNRVVLARNEDWWGRTEDENKMKFNFPKIVFRWISDSTVSLEMLKQGKLDIIGMNAETYIKKAKGKGWGKDFHKKEILNKAPKGYCFLGMNLKGPILKNKTVRKALYHLLNRKLMIEKFQYNKSVPAVGPVSPTSAYATPNLKAVEFNPKKALKMLRSVGWTDSNNDGILDKNGKKLSLTILEPGSSFIKYLTIFKEDASKIGVEIIIKQIEWNSFLKLVTKEKKFDMCRLCWSAVVDWDPKQIWHSSSIEGGSNFISYSNKKVDTLIDKALYIFDRDERIKVLRKVEQQIIDDVPYLFFMYQAPSFYGYTDRMKRVKDTYNYTIGTSYWKFKSTSAKLSAE